MAIEKMKELNLILEYYYKMQLEQVKQTGQLPDDMVGEVQQMKAQEQAEAQAQQEQQQMAAQQQQQQQMQ